MAAASISSLFAPSLSYSKPFKHPPSSLPLCFNLVRPPSNPTRISSLRINHRAVRVSRCTFHLTMAAKLEDTDAELPSDAEPSSPSPSLTEATFDIKLPRRSLLVQFTCDACGERTQRTINRVAYERGTVFVQAPLRYSERPFGYDQVKYLSYQLNTCVPDVSNITNWLIILVSLLSMICERKQGMVKILASIKFSMYHTFSCFIFFFLVPFSSRISQCSLKWLMSSMVWPVLECQHVIGLML